MLKTMLDILQTLSLSLSAVSSFAGNAIRKIKRMLPFFFLFCRTLHLFDTYLGSNMFSHSSVRLIEYEFSFLGNKVRTCTPI